MTRFSELAVDCSPAEIRGRTSELAGQLTVLS